MNGNNSSRRLILTSLTLVLILGISTSQAFAETGSGEPFNGVSQPLVDPIPIVPQVDCNTDTGTIVAYETSRGQTTNSFATMIGDLQNNGYTVRWMDIVTQQGIPSCITKMVIANIGPFDACLNAGNPYTLGEATSVANWVSAGGEVLVLNEHSGCGNVVVPITTALGETKNLAGVSSQIYTSGVNYDPNNPATLFAGVASWQSFAPASYVNSVDEVVTDASGDAIMISKSIGSGCALLASDSNWAAEDFIPGSGISSQDNQQLALNSILWLNECTEPPVGGEFLPIDTAALLLAGAQTNAVWIMSALAVIGSIAFGALYITSKKN